MVEIINAFTGMAERIGGPMTLTFVIICAAGYVVVWNKKLIDQMQQFSQETITANTSGMGHNTDALKELTYEAKKQNSILEKFGSDPMKMCQSGAHHDSLSNRVDDLSDMIRTVKRTHAKFESELDEAIKAKDTAQQKERYPNE